MVTKFKDVLLVVATLLVLLWAVNAAGAQSIADLSSDTLLSPMALTTSPQLHYQGRLTDPGTGVPLTDGSYTMTFSIYAFASGGTALWTETKSVEVKTGVFSTTLGDTSVLSQSIFDGQKLWLGVKVGTDPEATPRQQILPVAYALSLVPGAEIDGNLTIKGDLAVNGSINGADSYIWFDTNAMVSDDVASQTGLFALANHWNGGARFVCIDPGTGWWILPMQVPAVLFGQNVRLEEVRIWVQTDPGNGTTYIDSTYMYTANIAGSGQYIISDSTNRWSGGGGSFSFSPGFEMSSSTGNFNLLFKFNCGAVSDWIHIRGVRIRLGHN